MNLQNPENKSLSRDLEIEATISFVNKISQNFTSSAIQFHVCRLIDAINEACMAELDRRKVLCLYLYNAADKFSSIFCETLKNPEVVATLNRNFFLLGWDIEENEYQNALAEALNKCSDLSILTNMVISKVSAVLCIVPIKDSATIFSCINGKVSNKDFLAALSNAEQFLLVENQQEKKLEELAEKTGSENDMNSANYQKLMADMLGDRDYDSFEFNQHDYLKKKIAFAMLGPPQKEEGYEKKDIKKIEALYNSILKSSNKIAKYKDKVEISFIYNCTEPLPSEKLSRAKKYKEEYNPNTDVMPLPVFILRKCRGSANPCRIFVDNSGRTYNTWQDYISRNKLHKCQMILPLNGRYEVNENDELLLEKYLSPACGIDSKLLQGADYLSTAGGLISGAIFAAAIIPTIAVAPEALIAGGVIGLGFGIYSLGRGAYTLFDRKSHKETLNFINSEARGAYLNIVASSLGFVGVGATMVVSQLASMGINIGQGAGAVLNTIGIAEISASGLNIINSGYDMIDYWYNENRASLLTILQLKSSILFFGNTIHTFEMDNIDMTDVRTLQDSHEFLRNNRLRKAFSKLLKESIYKNKQKKVKGKIEVVSPIRKAQKEDGIFAALMRSNEEMEKYGVIFCKDWRMIKLNDITIDVNQFSGISKKDSSLFLSNCQKTYVTSLEIKAVTKIINDTLCSNHFLPNLENFANYATRLLSCYSNDIKCKIFDVIAVLLSKPSDSFQQILNVIFTNQSKYFRLTEMTIGFFSEISERLEGQYNIWINTHEEKYHQPLFNDVDSDKTKRAFAFFEEAVNTCYEGICLTEKAEKDLLNYFYHWLAEQIYEYQIKIETKSHRNEHSVTSHKKEVACSICGGFYYQSI